MLLETYIPFQSTVRMRLALKPMQKQLELNCQYRIKGGNQQGPDKRIIALNQCSSKTLVQEEVLTHLNLQLS